MENGFLNSRRVRAREVSAAIGFDGCGEVHKFILVELLMVQDSEDTTPGLRAFVTLNLGFVALNIQLLSAKKQAGTLPPTCVHSPRCSEFMAFP